MFGFGSKGKEEKSSNSNSVTTTQLCRVCKRSCFFHRFQHQKTEVSVCATCYFEGKIAPDTKHDEYQEIGSALSVYCGLCGAICNTHYFMSKGQPLEIQAGKLHKEGIRTLCPLCQGRASTSVDTLPENFKEEKEMWPIIKSGSLDDFEEKGLQKVIMSFGSAGGMFEKMYSIVNWLRNTLRWDQQEIWIDREQIWRHPDWQQKYQNALKESPVIIFMLSMAWVNSKYCLQELEWWQSLPHKEKPTAMVCILEHEVLQTEQFKEIAKILWKDVAWNDVVKFKLSDIIDLSVIGGRETLAAKLNFLFPDMERFVDQGKHALKSGIQSMVDATITGFQKLSWSNNS